MVFKIIDTGSIPVLLENVKCFIMGKFLSNVSNNTFSIYNSFKDYYIYMIYPFYKKFFEKNVSLEEYFRYVRFNHYFNYIFSFKLLEFLIILLDNLLLKYINNKYDNWVSSYKLQSSSWKFYYKLDNDYSFFNYFKKLTLSYLVFFRYLWLGLRFWIIGLILFITVVYYFSYIRLLPFSKLVFEWLLVVMFVYWLMSGFVFFIKKYQYSKFTSVIQRFWKRTYILFWLIESCIFMVFFYLTLNASEEPTYMYDQMKIYKFHLFSWRWFLIKLIPVILIILVTYYLQLSLKWNIFNKQSVIYLLITCLLIYIVWLEFYQFFHIISFYGNLNWVYDADELLWNLEIESRRTRLSNNYIAVCLMAKFWHLVFIFVFWVFFLLRINEIQRIRYPLLSANYQNFLILYMMSWLYMTPWLKFIFRKQLDISYYWFFSNSRSFALKVFFNDLKLFYLSLFNYVFSFSHFFSINYFYNDFYYFIQSSILLDFNQYKKHILKDYLINYINE